MDLDVLSKRLKGSIELYFVKVYGLDLDVLSKRLKGSIELYFVKV